MGKIKKILEKELGSTQSVEVYPVTSIEAIYDENNERLDNIINRKNNETQKELKAEVARATNAESNLRETINNITEINENATSASIVTIDTIPNTSSSNVQQALNELFKNATFAGIATPETTPETPTAPVYYMAIKSGTYSNFDGTVLNGRTLSVFCNDTKGVWHCSSVGEMGGTVNMNPYFPFADTATFYYQPGNNSGLEKDVAMEMFYGIMIDKGERTDKMYLGRLEIQTSNSNLFGLRLAINGVDVLNAGLFDKRINNIVFYELVEFNNSGYHGYIALNPSKFIRGGSFITSALGGTFERFALSENIFNSNPLIETWLNTNEISEAKSVFDNFEGNYVKYEQSSSDNDNDNLINQYYRTEDYLKSINELNGITTDIYSTKVSSTYPYFLQNKREFFFSKDFTNNGEGNIRLKSQILLREINNIKFETWIYFGLKTNLAKAININFSFGKIYPFGQGYSETSFVKGFANKTDYSEAKNSKIEYVVSNTILGDIVFCVDDYIELPTGGKLIHVTMEKDIPIRYGVLWLWFDGGYVTPGNVFGEDVSVINPILTTNDKYKYTVDKSAYNSGYSLLKGDFLTRGKIGRINETSVKNPMSISTRAGVNMEVIDKGDCADLVLKGDNLCNADNTLATLLQVSMGNYYTKPFDNTGKMYIQFGVKIEDCLKIKYFRHSNTDLFQPIRLLSEGIKLKDSNNYANIESFVIKVTDDGMAIVRLEMYNTGTLNLNIVSDEVIQELRLYNFCVSEKPIDPVNGVFISEQRAKYGNIAGKSFTIFGDSEFNPGLQYLNVTSRLGMPCYCATYGGHKMAWAGDTTDVDAVTKSWLYTWDIRKLVLANNTDFYIFCVSTNDGDAGGTHYEYQSVKDEDVQYVLDNYPAYGDDDEMVNSKLAIFNGLDTNTKNEKFNMSSVYCAYIEQILMANPSAKIILANSPITCTGLLTNTQDENNKGIWAEGQNPKTARIARKPVFDKLSELMNKIGEKYNLPVIDFYRNVGLTFENYTNYCVDGTHWTDINNDDVLANTSPIQNREGDLLVKYLTELIH